MKMKNVSKMLSKTKFCIVFVVSNYIEVNDYKTKCDEVV
jgi:hypothetical protein